MAAAFGKEHKDVLRDIRNLLVSKDFIERNLINREYTDSIGRSLPMFHLTRDGFMLLAMGYTGAKAMALKEAYINEFNRMEVEIANRPTLLGLPDFTDPAAAAVAWDDDLSLGMWNKEAIKVDAIFYICGFKLILYYL